MDEKYRRVQFLGKGGFGKVYKYVQLATNVECAVKMIKLIVNTREIDWGSVSALREIKILKELKHPNIIEVCFLTEKNLYRQNNSLWTHFLE